MVATCSRENDLETQQSKRKLVKVHIAMEETKKSNFVSMHLVGYMSHVCCGKNKEHKGVSMCLHQDVFGCG